MNNFIYPYSYPYDYYKQKVRKYEVEYQLNFDKILLDLRNNSFNSPYMRINNKYEGKIFESRFCGPFMVTEYFNYDNIAIIFLNTGYRMIARANNISKGEIKDPYSISILGIGYVGVGPYSIDGSSYNRMVYSRWRGILDRCYIKKEGNKTVHTDWHNFQLFAAWFESEFYVVPYNTMYQMVIDKDILVPGNEEYSPYKCLLVPNFVNSRIQLKEYDRERISKLKEGTMTYYEITKLYKDKTHKESIVHQMADEYKDILPIHVYTALKRYKMF